MNEDLTNIFLVERASAAKDAAEKDAAMRRLVQERDAARAALASAYERAVGAVVAVVGMEPDESISPTVLMDICKAICALNPDSALATARRDVFHKGFEAGQESATAYDWGVRGDSWHQAFENYEPNLAQQEPGNVG